MIFHADGNAFYASAEQIFRPDLRGKPVVVLSNNDGIIIALNREAKALGLVRGDPYFKVVHKCSVNGVAVFSSNYTLYADISRRITSIYLEYAPVIEEYSIDESFLFFDDCNLSQEDWQEIGWELKRRVLKEVGMPICVGAAPTKTLAKLYNKRAKEHGGVFVYSPQDVDGLLESTEVGTIWNVGPASVHTLHRLGIYNALQLKNMDLALAKKKLTVRGFNTVMELRGKRMIDRIEKERKDVVTSSRQFGRKVYELKELECAVLEYASLAVERLRQQQCECGMVCVCLSTCSYSHPLDSPMQSYSNSAVCRTYRMTSYTPEIGECAIACLRHIYRKGYGYRTVMVTLMDLQTEAMQNELFIDPRQDRKKRQFMKALDQVNGRCGWDALQLAGAVAQDGWQMRRNFLSPNYTTRLADIPKIR